MKKSLKLISIFMLLITIMTYGFVITKSQTSKAAYAPIESSQTILNNSTDGSVVISEKGSITINYKYGFTHLLIEVYECTQYFDKDFHDLSGFEDKEDRDLSNAASCGSFTSTPKIIHLSGRNNTQTNKDGSRAMASYTVHLLDQPFLEYDEMVKLVVYTELFSSDASNRTILYCNSDAVSGSGCEDPAEDAITSHYSGVSEKDIYFVGDKKRLIYANSSGGISWNSVGQTYVRVDNSSFSIEKDSKVGKLIYDDIIPALVTVLLIAAAVSIAVLGYQIIKTADEGQERHDKIVRLRNILIGIAIALLLLFVIEPIAEFVEGYLE